MSRFVPSATSASIRDIVERCRLRNDPAIAEITQRVQRREYTIILGPRFSEKTFLLQDVARELTKVYVVPVLVDLEDLKQSTGPDFVAALADAIAAACAGLGPLSRPPRDERELQNFLEELPDKMQRDMVLLFDHLEILPVNNIVVLLRVLRAILTEAQARDPKHSICAVATSTFAVADISLGPVSPFNVAQPVWIGDLDAEDTVRLVNQIAELLDFLAADGFGEAVYAVTRGDRYAIARLFLYCAASANNVGRDTVTIPDLDDAINSFLDRADEYQPFQETRRSLEHDPESLLALTTILKREVVSARELPISIQRPDHLRLTGAVQMEMTDDGPVFRPRSELYKRHLSAYYHAARVSRVLFVAGCFAEAIEYLRRQPDLKTNRRNRYAFLDSITGAVFAARSGTDAVNMLAEHIHAAFGMRAVAVYLVAPTRAQLAIASVYGSADLPRAIRLNSDVLEVHGFKSDHYVMDAEQRRLAIPLRDPHGEAAGVVVVVDFDHGPREDEFAELLAFVRRVAKALMRVLDYERRIDQLERLQTTSQAIASSLDLDEVLRKTVEEGINAISGAERGVLVLYDYGDKKLHMREPIGFRPTFADEVVVDPDGKSYAAKVFRTGETQLIPDATTDPRVTMRSDPDIAKQLSALCVPLFAWGRRTGAFLVDNTTAKEAFRKVDEGLLSAFAAHAAVSIQNAMVYQELYDLSLTINGVDLHAEDIFRRAVRSIVRVTAATAANMLLLPDTDPADAVARRPQVFAEGMSDDFERELQPRPDGITFHVLQTKKKYVIVPSSDNQLSINPLAAQRGVAATIALSLSIGGQVRGVLFVNFNAPHEFSAEEIRILSLYANVCAVAIERVRREESRLHASVAWMGLDLSEMGHDITQAVARLQSNLYLLSRHVKSPKAAELVAAARQDADDVAAVPKRALVPGTHRVEVFDVLNLIRSEADQWCRAHQEITLNLDEIASVSAFVVADPRRLAKVLKTLMQNAVRAAKSSTSPAIRIKSAIRGRIVEVAISNTGTVIPADVKERLFREPARSAEGGQGVGLLIARAIVFGYAGDLQCTSSEDNLTTFTLTLPLALHAPEGEAAS